MNHCLMDKHLICSVFWSNKAKTLFTENQKRVRGGKKTYEQSYTRQTETAAAGTLDILYIYHQAFVKWISLACHTCRTTWQSHSLWKMHTLIGTMEISSFVLFERQTWPRIQSKTWCKISVNGYKSWLVTVEILAQKKVMETEQRGRETTSKF